jgi:glutathione synthase/RimK-type ligase-like ATP-grasp enzyme
VPYAEWKAFDELTDKWRLLKLAQVLNISTPKTEFVSEVSSIPRVSRILKFPVVMKPYRSMIPCGGRWIPTSVQYARLPEELKQIVARYEYFNEHPFLIQEYVSNRGSIRSVR